MFYDRSVRLAQGFDIGHLFSVDDQDQAVAAKASIELFAWNLRDGVCGQTVDMQITAFACQRYVFRFLLFLGIHRKCNFLL